MGLIFLAHPIGGDVPANVLRAIRWATWVRLHYPSYAVVAPYILEIQSGADDANPAERKAGIEKNGLILSRCDQLWLVGGRISSGMMDEAGVAEKFGIPLMDLTFLGVEPPAGRDYRADHRLSLVPAGRFDGAMSRERIEVERARHAALLTAVRASVARFGDPELHAALVDDGIR